MQQLLKTTGFLICFFCSTVVFSQSRLTDSLRALADHQTNDSLKAWYYSKTAKELWYINADSSLFYNRKAESIALRKQIKGMLPYCYNNYGVLDFIQGNYGASLSHYFKGLKGVGTNTVMQGILLNNIGMSYAELRDAPKAMEYYGKTLQVKKLMGDSSRLATTYVNLGNVNVTIGKDETAKAFFDTALVLSKKYKDRIDEADSHGNIGNYFFRKKKFTEAEGHCREALRIKSEIEDHYGYATSLSDLCAILMAEKKYGEVESILREAEKISLDNQYTDLLLPIYRNFSDLYQSRSDYKQALSYLSRSMAIKDTLFADGKLREAAVKESQYAFEIIQVKDSLENLNQQRETKLVHDKELLQQRMYTYSGIIAFIAMLIVALFIFRAFKQKKRSNAIIEKQKQEVELQKQVIEEHQKETIDSINYAKRIQYALLANEALLSQNLKEHFVLFQPKDIVSGDFYWATEHNDKFYLAVCDSTGHGVPGAFMSLLNIGFLSEAIKEKEIVMPHEVFNYVRARLIQSIGKEEQQDGMDGLLFCFEKNSDTVYYAAANNAPVLIRKGEMLEMGKDKMPVGKGQKTDSFVLHSFVKQAGDVLYAYTDGYADQFGGPKGKKYKYKSLNELLLKVHHLPLKEQEKMIMQAFADWKGKLEQVDDVCIAGIRL